MVVLLNSLVKYYPGKPLKSVFVEMQGDNAFWGRFKAKYPHADVHNFHLDNTDGEIFIMATIGLGVKESIVVSLVQMRKARWGACHRFQWN